jgi:hypothetical protein
MTLSVLIRVLAVVPAPLGASVVFDIFILNDCLEDFFR